ncbi:MAG: hypothetical protein ACREIF_06830 [Chthoniobacterales bacterium]
MNGDAFSSFEVVRVGAIEIGTGSVRFVALDVESNNAFRIVDSDGFGIDRPNNSRCALPIDAVADKAKEYMDRCARKFCKPIVAFGTEGTRLWSQQLRERFLAVVPSFTTLSVKQEATFAHFGSLLGLQSNFLEDPFMTMDVGRGSVQLAVGKSDRNFVRLSEWMSWPSGTHVARDIFHKCNRRIEETCDQLSKLISPVRFEATPPEDVAILGNCATTLGRITQFPAMDRPKLPTLHGLELTYQDVENAINLYQREPEKFRGAIEGHNRISNADTTLGGFLVLRSHLINV